MSDEGCAELHAATPPGWHVGRPMFHDERNEWQMYAFDTSERPDHGARKREWTAIGPTEHRVIQTMAYCPRQIAAGRVPK